LLNSQTAKIVESQDYVR